MSDYEGATKTALPPRKEKKVRQTLVSTRASRRKSATPSGCASELPVAAIRSAQAASVRRRFAENLIALRGGKSLSQAVLACRAGLHLTEVGLLERSLRMPRLDTIVKLAGALEVEACDLLAGMAWRLGGESQQGGSYVRRDPTGPPEPS